jgi:hypothetical protein
MNGGSAVPAIPILDAAHDCPHAPTRDETFQESALFVWHDLEAGVGGFCRLGQEPVAGAINSCFGLFTSDGLRFRSNVSGVALQPGDRSETHMGWGSAIRIDLDSLTLLARFPDCEANLRFEDFFPRYDYLALVGLAMPEGHSGHHFEVAGRMTGRVRLGDREFQVNALGYRDRSWGGRRWDTMRGTRWWPAVFGPDLTIHVLATVMEGGIHGCRGYLLRDGVPHAMSEADVAVTLDYDAIGPRAGHARFRLDSGEEGELVHERSDGVVLHVRGYTAVESIGIARYGDRIGMSNLEVSTNPAGGTKPPVIALNASYGDGLSWREGARERG